MACKAFALIHANHSMVRQDLGVSVSPFGSPTSGASTLQQMVILTGIVRVDDMYHFV